MKAVVLRDGRFVLDDKPDPVPGSGQILVAISDAGALLGFEPRLEFDGPIEHRGGLEEDDGLPGGGRLSRNAAMKPFAAHVEFDFARHRDDGFRVMSVLE